MEFETIAEITRLTARISLVLFSISFTAMAFDAWQRPARDALRAFVSVHFIHLGFVIAYFVTLGSPPEFSPATIALFLGVGALMWAMMEARKQRPVWPLIPLWYIWSLFTLAHVTRLLDPARGTWLNALLLGIIGLSGLAHFAASVTKKRNTL